MTTNTPHRLFPRGQPADATRSASGEIDGKVVTGTYPTDAVLVAAAQGGNRWAQEALFRRHAPLAMGLAYRLLGKDDDVEDVVQEAFFNALKSLHRLRDPQAFASWLAGIVVRMVRRVHRRKSLLRRIGLYSDASADSNLALSHSTPPEVVSELNHIYSLLNTLPIEVRLVFLLRRVEGYTLPEIAELLQCSLSTVKRRWSEADRVLNNYASEGL